MVESALFDTVPKVTKYQAVELRNTGIKVLVYGSWKFIGPAAGRKWFTDRDKMVRHVKRLLEQSLRVYLSRARSCADALEALPTLETHLCPPAERGEHDKRPEI